MEIKLYNSYNNALEVFKPIRENEVSMYVCGPTVYSYVHIGNMRPVVVFDVLRRFFEYVGYKVTHISNITDVDDKIIKAALEEGVSEKAITDKYAASYFKTIADMNALKPTFTPCVTENIQQIIQFIQELIEKEFAYESDGDVYFRVNKVKEYGKLANLSIEDLRVGARIEENKSKENPLDFALWKKTSIGVNWKTAWSNGRPGWHTECVVMINECYPGARIDIHGGGFDLKFPHHENEIAQSLANYGHTIANYWLHNGFINLDNEKMSKSLGNVKLAKDLIEEFGGNIIRLILISTHYRAPVNFTSDILENSKNELNKINSALKQVQVKLQLCDYQKQFALDQNRINDFLKELANDLNTSNALMILFETIKELNLQIRKNDFDQMQVLYCTVVDMLDILGLTFEKIHLSEEDKKLYQDWEECKKNKDFVNADKVRNDLVTRKIL